MVTLNFQRERKFSPRGRSIFEAIQRGIGRGVQKDLEAEGR
jgi:hypothetical protein